jgi:hypothetical protein
LDDDSPPLALRGKPKKIESPTLVTQGKHSAVDVFSTKSDSGSKETGKSRFDSRIHPSSSSSCPKENDPRTDHCGDDVDVGYSCSQCMAVQNRQGGKNASLYMWPGFEQIEMYGVDDLDSEAVFVLDATKSFSQGHRVMKIYVWVGKYQEQQQSQQPRGEEEDATWYRIGEDFLRIVELPSNVAIEVDFLRF